MKKKKRICMLVLTAVLAVSGASCGSQADLSDTSKEASATTKEANGQVYAALDFKDQQEKEFAEKGLIAAPENLELKDETGKVIWSQKAYNFVENKEAPDTVNPSLWRNTQNNHLYGLFKVTDVYKRQAEDQSLHVW